MWQHYHRLQQILLRIHQYRAKITYKPSQISSLQTGYPDKNHKDDKDEEITGMQVNIGTVETATNIPEYMMIHELQHKTAIANHLQQLKEHIIKRWPENKDFAAQNLRPYWTFWEDMAVLDKSHPKRQMYSDN